MWRFVVKALLLIFALVGLAMALIGILLPGGLVGLASHPAALPLVVIGTPVFSICAARLLIGLKPRS